MVDLGTVLVAAPGWGVTAYAALALAGKAPMRLRRWDKDRIEDEHAKIVREQKLDILAAKTDLILAAISPNGGASLFDKVARIEIKLDDHIDASDKVEARVYAEMADLGHEVDAVARRVAVVERRDDQNPPREMGAKA